MEGEEKFLVLRVLRENALILLVEGKVKRGGCAV
jgi:hypothetical protein